MYQSSSTENSFIDVDSHLNGIKKEDKKQIFTIEFIKDSKSVTYQRSVLTFLDCCGLIGGVNEILRLIGILFVSSISGKLFVFNLLSLISKLKLAYNFWIDSN